MHMGMAFVCDTSRYVHVICHWLIRELNMYRTEQLVGLNWLALLYKNEYGGILADEMV